MTKSNADTMTSASRSLESGSNAVVVTAGLPEATALVHDLDEALRLTAGTGAPATVVEANENARRHRFAGEYRLASFRRADGRCRAGHLEVGTVLFRRNVIRGNAHTAHVVASKALT